MGGSAALIWQVISKARYPIITRYAKRGIVFFMIHFLFNLAWTPVFFGLHQTVFAFVILLIILVSLIFLIRHFFRLDRLSAFLLIPYLLWVTFASALNLAIILLN
jgi:tryptophan-rich sensory protein